MKYIITGDCNGVPYYARVSNYKTGYAPDFDWEGLQDNASKFKSEQLAIDIYKMIKPYSKIPMNVIPVKSE